MRKAVSFYKNKRDGEAPSRLIFIFDRQSVFVVFLVMDGLGRGRAEDVFDR